MTDTVVKKRRYDAGSRAPRLKSWYTQSTDATAAIQNPQEIRNRSRDLVRNDPWANHALSVIVNNCVGFGIRCQIRAKSKGRLKQVQSLWTKWAETTAIDATGQFNLYGLQQLAFRCMVESGEVLIRLRPRRPEDNLPIPFQIQIIEPDLIADSVSLMETGGIQNPVIRGIEYDALGRRVAYYLYKTHPGAELPFRTADYTRIPAEEIIHLFRTDRPGQERGVSWFAPVTITLRELGIYEDAYLVRQQLANLFAGFLISNDPNDLDDLPAEIPDLQPGTLYALKPGTEIQFSTPPQAGSDPKYRDSCLRRVAAGLGITYEALTGNLSEVNYSSSRVGSNEFGRNIDAWLWTLFIPRFCDGIFNWFLNALEMQGFSTADLSAEWTPPARTIVDEAKAFNALLTAVKSGFISLPEAIRQQGFDPDSVLAEQAEYLQKLDAAGVKVESDYRNSSNQMPIDPAQADPAQAGADSAQGVPNA